MIFPVFLMIFDKVELFGIRSQLFKYSNSIRFLKSNKYEYNIRIIRHNTALDNLINILL